MVIFHSYVKLPEGRLEYLSILMISMDLFMDYLHMGVVLKPMQGF